MNRFKISCKRLFCDESLILNYRNVKKIICFIMVFILHLNSFQARDGKNIAHFIKTYTVIRL